MPAQPDTCETCKYFGMSRDSKKHVCLRYPPVHTPTGDVQPEVDEDTTACGEYDDGSLL